MVSGNFITFEGGEGAGKSTQVRLLAEALENKAPGLVTTREPGGAPGAEQIRELLVSGATNRWQPLTEALLNHAARIEHLEHTIKPALQRGQWVISDRFADSTLAYQGYGHGIDLEHLENLQRVVIGDFKPNLTFVMDLPVEEGLRRALDRGDGEDRYERMGIDFHNRLRAGFLTICEKQADRCVLIDATQDIDSIHRSIIDAVHHKFPELSR